MISSCLRTYFAVILGSSFVSISSVFITKQVIRAMFILFYKVSFVVVVRKCWKSPPGHAVLHHNYEKCPVLNTRLNTTLTHLTLLLDKRFFVWIYIKTFILDEYKPEIRPSFLAKDSPLKDCSSLLTNTPTKTTQEDNSPFASQLDSLDLHLESSPFLNTPTKSPSSKIEVRALQNRGKSFMKSMM